MTKSHRTPTATKGSTTTTYTYDMAGVRSSKKVGDTLYRFDTLSGQVTHQEWTDSSSTQQHLYFIYDNSNQPYALLHQTGTGTPTLYYYILNLQGDVIGLMNSDADIVVNYQYDPWGAVLSCTGTEASTIGAMNPLRYRGYYYDTETGFYYLQSRYYDPALGRFINADTYSTTDTQGFLSYNMFAYCENDPVNREDRNGDIWQLAMAGGATMFAASPVGLAVIGALVVGVTAASIIHYSKAKSRYKKTHYPQKKKEVKEVKQKPRSTNPIARRLKFKSKKDAQQAAQRAGKGKKPTHHRKHDGDNRPHYHPDVDNKQRTTPKKPSSHDHYYYPRSSPKLCVNCSS